MALKHTGRSVLSIPIGISIGIHSLLVMGLIFLSWEKPAPKPELSSIKISHISLDQKKAVIPKEPPKPVKEDPKSLKSSQPIKPSTPTSDNSTTDLQVQPAKMVANTVQRFLPDSTHKARSQNSINKLGKPVTRTAAIISNYSPHSFATPTLHKEITARSVTHELGKPLTQAVANISTYAKHSILTSNLHTRVTARTIEEGLNSSPLKASPTPGLQVVERWIPVSKSHPVQFATIPSDFVDEISKSASLASVNEKTGRSSGDTESSGQNLDAVRKEFSSSIWGKIAQAKYYPSLARKRGWEGKPIVEFKLARNGDLLSSAITLNSPYKILNEAALDAIKNAAPYPKIPDTLKVDSIRFKLPISFILDEP